MQYAICNIAYCISPELSCKNLTDTRCGARQVSFHSYAANLHRDILSRLKKHDRAAKCFHPIDIHK
jgi:hypothetical protein